MATRSTRYSYTLVNRVVSSYVIEGLGLTVGDQTNLIAIRSLTPWKSGDQVMIVARAMKQLGGLVFLNRVKYCYDEADRTVYVLVHLDFLAKDKQHFTFHVGNDTVVFYNVKSIAFRENTSKEFQDISVHTRGTRSVKDLEVQTVSLFVIENLDLVPGDQSRLFAVKGLESANKLKLVFRVVKQNRGPSFIPNYKYALEVSDIVYVLAPDAGDVKLMAGRSFRVADEDISFYCVLKIDQLEKSVDPYQSAYCDKVWPLS